MCHRLRGVDAEESARQPRFLLLLGAIASVFGEFWARKIIYYSEIAM